MKVIAYIAGLGQSIQFVAFVAHFAVAALVVEHAGRHRLAVMVIVIAAAAVKEFWFDARYESNPPQTPMDNFQDWAGWAAGAIVGVFL